MYLLFGYALPYSSFSSLVLGYPLPFLVTLLSFLFFHLNHALPTSLRSLHQPYSHPLMSDEFCALPSWSDICVLLCVCVSGMSAALQSLFKAFESLSDSLHASTGATTASGRQGKAVDPRMQFTCATYHISLHCFFIYQTSGILSQCILCITRSFLPNLELLDQSETYHLTSTTQSFLPNMGLRDQPEATHPTLEFLMNLYLA